MGHIILSLPVWHVFMRARTVLHGPGTGLGPGVQGLGGQESELGGRASGGRVHTTQGLGCRVRVQGLGVQVTGLGGQGAGSGRRTRGSGCRVKGQGLGGQVTGLGGQGAELRGRALGCRASEVRLQKLESGWHRAQGLVCVL